MHRTSIHRTPLAIALLCTLLAPAASGAGIEDAIPVEHQLVVDPGDGDLPPGAILPWVHEAIVHGPEPNETVVDYLDRLVLAPIRDLSPHCGFAWSDEPGPSAEVDPQSKHVSVALLPDGDVTVGPDDDPAAGFDLGICPVGLSVKGAVQYLLQRGPTSANGGEETSDPPVLVRVENDASLPPRLGDLLGPGPLIDGEPLPQDGESLDDYLVRTGILAFLAHCGIGSADAVGPSVDVEVGERHVVIAVFPGGAGPDQVSFGIDPSGGLDAGVCPAWTDDPFVLPV